MIAIERVADDLPGPSQGRRAVHVGRLAVDNFHGHADDTVDTRRIRHDVQRKVGRAVPTSDCRRKVASHARILTLLQSARRLDSWFFNKGQVIETHRGKGIYQKAIDEATYKLEQGQWVSRHPASQGFTGCLRWRSERHVRFVDRVS